VREIRVKNRNNLNLLIDALLFTSLAALAGIGWLIKFTLPPGRDRILKYGENREFFFLGWDRHQWGTIHLVVALVMLGLLVLHLVFHWKVILGLARNAVPSRSLRLALTGGLILTCAVLFMAAFVVQPEKSETDDFLYRNARSSLREPGFASNPPDEARPTETKAGGKLPDKVIGESPTEAGKEKDHRPGTGTALLTAQITLNDSAAALGISPSEAKLRLGLPDDYPGTETLGRLRRTRGLTMIQIRDLLEKSR